MKQKFDFKRICIFIFLFFIFTTFSEEKKEILKFLVMGDPQFGLKIPGDYESGFIWSSHLWEKMPEICKKLNVKYFFICGDIFGLETGSKNKRMNDVCNELASKIFWDEWEKYLKKFENICKVEVDMNLHTVRVKEKVTGIITVEIIF